MWVVTKETPDEFSSNCTAILQTTTTKNQLQKPWNYQWLEFGSPSQGNLNV